MYHLLEPDKEVKAVLEVLVDQEHVALRQLSQGTRSASMQSKFSKTRIIPLLIQLSRSLRRSVSIAVHNRSSPVRQQAAEAEQLHQSQIQNRREELENKRLEIELRKEELEIRRQEIALLREEREERERGIHNN